MAAENRDSLFEKALARHFRDEHTRCNCPDAETLAAFYESALAAEQLAPTKEHITSCARCQEMIAQLAVTAEIRLESATPAESVAGIAAPPATAMAAAPVHVLKPRRMSLWRWAAPAGALAAGLLVWITVRENTPLRLPEHIETKTQSPATPARAKREDRAEPVTPDSRSGAAPAATPSSALSLQSRTEPTGAGQTPSTRADQGRRPEPQKKDEARADANDAAQLLSRDDASAKSAPSAPHTQPASPGARSQTVTISNEPSAKPDLQARESKEKQLDRKREGVAGRLATPAPPLPAPAAVGGAANNLETAGEVAPERKALAKRAAATPAPVPPAGSDALQEKIQGISRMKETGGAMLLANAADSVTVSSPDDAVYWRIGRDGRIVFSSDAGKTWIPQPSGVTTDLRAGSAPSAKVCWVVGSAGTILRTTDGGAHWQKIASPVQNDIFSIAATDSQRATISSALGSYETDDGGATWHKPPAR